MTTKNGGILQAKSCVLIKAATVGVGTTSPTAKLEVQGQSRTVGSGRGIDS